MTEEFLYYIWRYRLFDNNGLSFNEEVVKVLATGQLNRDGGPDFFNAKIKIGDTIWAGNVEIHVDSSDWYKHGHHNDKSYDNVILHVVYNNDVVISGKNDKIIPFIELKENFDEKLYHKYKAFMNNKNYVPCETLIRSVESIYINSWLERVLVERLEKKSEVIRKILNNNKHNWELTFYQLLARNFGFKVNAEPFELLAKSLPLNYLARHKSSLLQIEALLFGQAGLLIGKFKDDYPRELKNEYNFLKNKLSLIPIEGHLWKFLRLRPSNFPTIRIAQFANLIHRSSSLFSKIINSNNIESIKNLFELSTSEYWHNHYIFDKVSFKREKKIGKNTIDLIVINTIIIFIFVYGEEKIIEDFKTRALNFLEQIPGEKNSIINRWNQIGMDVSTAFNTQALLELKQSYCDKKRCLNCRIGNYLLRDIA